MARDEKLLARFRSKPKDFRWDELVVLMRTLGFELHHGSGSKRKFVHTQTQATFSLHEPHPSGILKEYQVRLAGELLKNEGYLP